MQDLSYYEVSVEFYQLADEVQKLMKIKFDIEIKLFDNIEQIIGAAPAELKSYMMALEARFRAYFSIIDPDYRLRRNLDGLKRRLDIFYSKHIDNSALISNDRRELVHSLLELFEEITTYATSMGYSVKPVNRHAAIRLYSKTTLELSELHNRTKVLSNVYKAHKS